MQVKRYERLNSLRLRGEAISYDGEGCLMRER